MDQLAARFSVFTMTSLMTNSTDDPNTEQNEEGESETDSPSYVEILQWYKDISTRIRFIWQPIIVVLGLFGNVMVLLIMRRIRLSSLGIFFVALAWCDLIMLFIGPLDDWLGDFGVPKIKYWGEWPCKVEKTVYYLTKFMSSWMIVGLTMQRAASVLWPHRVKAVWTKRTSLAVVAVLFIVIFLISCHFMFAYSRHPEHCGKSCCRDGASNMYRWFRGMIWPWVDLIQYTFLPFVLLVVSNTVLLWKLVASIKDGGSLSVAKATQDSRQHKVLSLTVTLIAISVVFILLTAPMKLRILYSMYFIDKSDPVEYGLSKVWSEAGQCLIYTNSAVNFYLYCLTGSRFRREFRNMMNPLFCRCRNGEQLSSDLNRPSTTKLSSAGKAVVPLTESRKDKAVNDDEF